MSHSIRLLLCLMTLVPMGISHGDEPLWVESHYLNSFFRDGFSELRSSNLERFGLNDRHAANLKQQIVLQQSSINERFADRLGASSWALMYFLKPDGKKTQVECFRVSKSDCLDILAEDFQERFGPESELRRRDAGIVLTGPTEIRVVNGRTETTSVIPMVLRQEGNWLLQSDDEYLLDLQFPSELLARLNRLNNFDWYFESRPADVPKRERSMMLQSVFARLGVMRQRRDNESLQAFIERAAPTELWEVFLRTYYFETEQLTLRKSHETPDAPVRYQLEVSAAPGTRFASALSDIGYRRPGGLHAGGLLSATLSMKIPDTVSAPLTSILKSRVPKGLGSFASSMATSLSDGRLDFMAAVNVNSDDKLGVVVELDHSDTSLPGTAVIDLHGRFQEFGTMLFEVEATPGDRTRHWLSQDGHRFEVDEKRALGGVLFAMRFDLKALAECPDDSMAGMIFRYVETMYLQTLFSRVYPRRTPPKDFAARKILDQIKSKITGGTSDDWSLEARVLVAPRSRKLTAELSVGPRLFAFAAVSNAYLRFIAQDPENENPFE